MDLVAVVVAALGLGLTAATFALTRWDARRADVSRPKLWATVTAGTVALGIGMYLFAPVPITGVLLTANTGPVLYGFERGIATEDEQPADPGALPGGGHSAGGEDDES